MKHALIPALAVVAVGLSACGGSHKTQAKALENSAQTKQAESAARTIAESCINKGGKVTAIFHCAVPPHHGAAFLRCAVDGAPKSVHNAAGIEADLVKCGEKYR